MSAVILPDGSLLFRLAERTVHVDAGAGAIVVRDGSARDELTGTVLAELPFQAAAMVRLLTESAECSHLYLELEDGDTLDLGRMPIGEMSRHVAYALARLARCRVSTTIEHTRARQVPHYEAETRRLQSGLVAPEDREQTLPRLGWSDSWRDDFIRASSAITPIAPRLMDDHPDTRIDLPQEIDRRPHPPIPTISAEIVDDESPTRPPAEPPRRDHRVLVCDLDDPEPTVRIDTTPLPKVAANR